MILEIWIPDPQIAWRFPRRRYIEVMCTSRLHKNLSQTIERIQDAGDLACPKEELPKGLEQNRPGSALSKVALVPFPLHWGNSTLRTKPNSTIGGPQPSDRP